VRACALRSHTQSSSDTVGRDAIEQAYTTTRHTAHAPTAHTTWTRGHAKTPILTLQCTRSAYAATQCCVRVLECTCDARECPCVRAASQRTPPALTATYEGDTWRGSSSQRSIRSCICSWVRRHTHILCTEQTCARRARTLSNTRTARAHGYPTHTPHACARGYVLGQTYTHRHTHTKTHPGCKRGSTNTI